MARYGNPLQQWYLIDRYGDTIIGVGKFSSRESARKKANNMVARDVELTGMLLVSYSDLKKDGYFDTPSSLYNNPRKRRNPAAIDPIVELVAGFVAAQSRNRFTLQDRPSSHANGIYLNFSTDDVENISEARRVVRAVKEQFPVLKVESIIEPEHDDPDRLEFFLIVKRHAVQNPHKRHNPASKADTVALALAKVDKRAGQVTGEDNSIEARAKRLRKSGYVVTGDPYGYGFPQQPKSIKAATILTEFKGGKVAPPSSSYSWSFDLNRELGNKAWEVYPVNSVATLIFKW